MKDFHVLAQKTFLLRFGFLKTFHDRVSSNGCQLKTCNSSLDPFHVPKWTPYTLTSSNILPTPKISSIVYLTFNTQKFIQKPPKNKN
jgi:hypothetical protein